MQGFCHRDRVIGSRLAVAALSVALFRQPVVDGTNADEVAEVPRAWLEALVGLGSRA